MITEPPHIEGSAGSSGSEDVPPPAGRGLRRDTEGGLIGGVCAGVAEATGWDVTLVRIAAVVLGVVSLGVVLYLLAWCLLPDQHGRRVFPARASGSGSATGPGTASGRTGAIVGAVAVAFLTLAVVTLVSSTVLGAIGIPGVHRFDGLLPSPRAVVDSMWRSWWILAVIVGGTLLFRQRRQPPTPAPPAVTGATGPEIDLPHPSTHSASATRPQGPPRPPALVGPVTLLVATVLVLVAFALHLLDAIRMNPGVVAGLVLAVLAGGLLVSSRRGRARGLLLLAVPLGLLLALLPLGRVRFDALGLPRDLSAGDLRPDTPVEVTAGDWTLDLRDSRRHSVDSVEVRQVAGRVTIILPTDRRSVVHLTVGTGDVSVERPSIESAVTQAPDGDGVELASSLVEGAPATLAELRRLGMGEQITPLLVTAAEDGRTADDGSYRFGSSTDDVDDLLGDTTDLSVDVNLGVGHVTLVDPRWVGTAPVLPAPTQMCLRAGGATGEVLPCSSIAPDLRVPVCGSDLIGTWTVVYDCRAIASESPQVACSNQRWGYEPCSTLGIAVDPDFTGGTGPSSATVPPIGAPFPTDTEPEPFGEPEPPDGTVPAPSTPAPSIPSVRIGELPPVTSTPSAPGQ